MNLVELNEFFENKIYLNGAWDIYRDGVVHTENLNSCPYLSIKLRKDEYELIKDSIDFVYTPYYDGCILYSENALDFIGQLYIKDKPGCISNIFNILSMDKATNNLNIQVELTRKDAVLPSKVHASDSGYDVHILEKIKTVGEVEYFTTGLKVKPPYGWYFDLVPRSSMSKTGYIMANSCGIIDRSYRGEIIVPLVKINKSLPDLHLPNRIAQIIPRRIQHFNVEQVENLDATNRNEGGFGSTN